MFIVTVTSDFLNSINKSIISHSDHGEYRAFLVLRLLYISIYERLLLNRRVPTSTCK